MPPAATHVYYFFGAGDENENDYQHSLDPRLIGGGIHLEASQIAGGGTSSSLILSEPGWLFSRAYNSNTGEWSALNTAYYTIDTIPADETNLVISEFSYRPANPTTPAELAISSDRDDYEFIELLNISSQTIDLTGVSLIDGVRFTFADHTLLEAGERIVLASHSAAFTARYGTPPFGEYLGSLSNSSETIHLKSLSHGLLHEFTYFDDNPWPTAADGDGFSLTLIAPLTNPNHNDASNWRTSFATNGTPGTTDSQSFDDWRTTHSLPPGNLDTDGDGLNDFGEYATGSSPHQASSGEVPCLTFFGNYLEIDVQRNPAAADHVELIVESSTDLITWQAVTDYIGEKRNTDGSAIVTYRLQTTGQKTRFVRTRWIAR